MIEVDHLEASKLDQSKKIGMIRAEWNAGPGEKMLVKRARMMETGMVRTAEETWGGDDIGGGRDAV